MKDEAKLGDMVKDTVSGFKGIAISEHNYLDGCTRVTIQPLIDKDGKLPGTETFDIPRLEVVDKQTHSVGNTENGGPDKYEDRER